MYTLLDDIKMAKRINDYITKNPTAHRKEIYNACITNERRAKYLRSKGLIALPPPMNKSKRWMMARKFKGMNGFKVRKENGIKQINI